MAEFEFRRAPGIGSSDSDNSSSEDEAGTWKRKRNRHAGMEEMDDVDNFSNPLKSAQFRRNNIWGDVVSEQTMSQDLLSFGVEGEENVAHSVSRDVESYKVSKDMLKLVTQEREKEASDGVMEDDLEGGDASQGHKSDDDDIFESKIFSKKAGVKDRLGCIPPAKPFRDLDKVGSDNDEDETQPTRKRREWRNRHRKEEANDDFDILLQKYQKEREEIKVGEKRKRDREKRFADKTGSENRKKYPSTVTVDDEPDVVIRHVLKGLDEANLKLFSLIVEVVGNAKVLDLYSKTLDVENVGGMMTMNGNRRRTPGGVFIQLLKSDKDITKEQNDVIFAESNEHWKHVRKQKKAAHRKSKHKKADKEVRQAMNAPGMEGAYRKLLDEQLTSYNQAGKKPSLAMETDGDMVHSERKVESNENMVMDTVPPESNENMATETARPRSPESGSEEGEILDSD